MRTTFGRTVASGLLTLATLVFASQAEAGWRWHGSSGGGSSGGWGGSSGGGSSGGWGGSSGGSWGGGSSGGGWGKHGGGWHGHKKWKRSWGGSSGGGWGGSSGGWGGSSGGGWGGSSGGWGGSSGGYGSSGGASYYAPGIDYGGYGYGGYETYPVDPATIVPGTTAPGVPAAPLPGDGALPGPSSGAPGAGAAPAETGLRRADGLLAVSVPEDAKIYVNGQLTSSTGEARQYVSRDLRMGLNYSYEVRAEAIRDGRTVEQVKTVNLRAGDTANLAFDFPASDTIETSLTLHVPADAKVFLAGNPTKASGETRVFRTTGLSGNKAWDSYAVRVELERGGRTLTKEETISLKAGQSQELSFEFEADKVASR